MSLAPRYAVEITAGAEQDLEDLVSFVASHDSRGKAATLLDRILSTADTLATAPQRGSVPRELQALGIREYRQTMFKPYRLIYTVREHPRRAVYIVLIADGRRDMAGVLQRRLLAAPTPTGPDPK